MQRIDPNNPIKVGYCIPVWLRDAQILANITKVKGRLNPTYNKRKDPIAVVCFGPSLDKTWKEVRKFKYIMSCSGAHKFLVERGIIPTWHVEVDPRRHKIELIGKPHKKVEYLISSACHPDVFDYLKDYKVRLWHVFDNRSETFTILPPNEWYLTGGPSVGLRSMVLARFLGFEEQHVFGMDGCKGETGSHTSFHPNAPKEKDYYVVEWGGKDYITTPSMWECAKATFHELDQLPGVKVKFYGEGLVQAMARDHKPSPIPQEKAVIAMSKPELISKEYVEQNAQLHEKNPMYGAGGAQHAKVVHELAKRLNTTSILDYGCGKGLLARELSFPIWEYDPAIPGKEAQPRPADIVVCTDVLEHVEPDKIGPVLDNISQCMLKAGYFVIHTGPAQKKYPNGKNTHLIQQDPMWWRQMLDQFFAVGNMTVKGHEVHFIVGKKTRVQELTSPVLKIDRNGKQLLLHANNANLEWRAKTIFTKEPHTIKWIENMRQEDVLYDVGANIGCYTLWAARQGIRVVAFEPESDNFAVLNANIRLNNLEKTAAAYPIVVSDKSGIGTLFLSKPGAGGSCHTLNENLDPKLAKRDETNPQGTYAVSIDDAVASGSLPAPTHIKIDVDGLEFKVLSGAKKTLRQVESILVEVNTKLPKHRKMVKDLQKMGFSYDEDQVRDAMRKEGPFEGCAEHIFRFLSPLERHILDRIAKATIVKKPFPHIYVENIFPADVYAALLKEIPGDKAYQLIEDVRPTKGYPQRYVCTQRPTIVQGIERILKTGFIRYAFQRKFGVQGELEDTLLIRDKKGYAIGPHTDSPRKVVSALFYLSRDSKQSKAGTSLYTPLKRGFKCPGGPHYDFAKFRRSTTVPYKPNSMLAFPKSDVSFHGVEKFKGTRRDVLLYNINKVPEPTPKPRQETPAQPSKQAKQEEQPKAK